MAKINDAERKTQDRVLRMFQNELGYKYYGNLRKQVNNNIMVDKLRAFLLKSYSAGLADRAIAELQKTAANLQQGLYKANQEVYSLLKYGAKVKENPEDSETTVYFIDWEHSHNNEFAVAEEVTLREKSERRPDLVVYINGIAAKTRCLRLRCIRQSLIAKKINSDITSLRNDASRRPCSLSLKAKTKSNAFTILWSSKESINVAHNFRYTN